MATKLRGRDRRRRRIRKKISGDGSRPRLCVFKSARHIYAQLIDDSVGKTIAAASSVEKDLSGPTGNKDSAKAVGGLIGSRALQKGVKQVVFDRGGYIYHGRVKALADAAREAGLDF